VTRRGSPSAAPRREGRVRASSMSHPASPAPLSMRGWLVIVGGVLSGAIILVAWLPVGALLHQRAELSSAESRLAQLSREAAALTAESNLLRSPEALAQLARAEYQLVAPGQRLIQVLTPSFTPSSRSSSGPYPGDPGFSALVDPTGTGAVGQAATGAPAPASTSPTAGAPRTASTTPPPGFLSRVMATLEFWR
jgi:cell division protein FtsB